MRSSWQGNTQVSPVLYSLKEMEEHSLLSLQD